MAKQHGDESASLKLKIPMRNKEENFDLVSCSPESLRFLHGASSRDQEVRKQAFQLVFKTLDGWFEGYGSPPVAYCSSTLRARMDLKQLIVDQLPDILRLSIDCPFSDVRESCGMILKDFQDRGMKIPRPNVHFASSFYCEQKTGFVGEDDQTQNLLTDVFLLNNRLEHVFQVMAYHPIYLEHFLRAHHHVLYGDGPLPYHYRHYIAIMAAAEHQCSYLIQIHSKEFLLQQGDRQWLQGLDYVPEKLRRLSEVNRILAHRPWLMNKCYLQKLSKASWSVSEMLHAIALLAHFHALTSFTFGCGITPELDQETVGYTYDADCFSGDSYCENHSSSNGHSTVQILQSPTVEVSIDELLVKMRQIHDAAANGDEVYRKPENKPPVDSDGAALNEKDNFCSQFVDDPNYAYEECSRREDKNGALALIAAEFSWEIHGYSLANMLCIDVATMLDEKFNVVQNLTYHTMGDLKNVDTSAFRQAVWNYSHCIYGIRHEDYDYGIVNQVVERSLQSFIKVVCCFPERITKADYESCMQTVRHSEKVHVNLILLEARLQAELLYGLKAVHDL